MIQRFDLFHVNTAPAVFPYDKLDWMNGVYIRNLPEEELLERLLPFWQAVEGHVIAGWAYSRWPIQKELVVELLDL